MLSIYLFFLTVKLLCTVMSGYFRLRMVYFKTTDTYSNLCFFLGYVLAFTAQVTAVFNSSSIASMLSNYDPVLVTSTQVIGAGVFVLFLMGTLRKYALSKPR